jgi:serine/threonine-protein kinase RsbW
MIESMPTADVANTERFERVGVAATPQFAAQMRDEFALWLKRFFVLDADRTNDLILAINEALANCAEFAYVNSAVRGTMDLTAAHDAAESAITVVVSDRGVWRITDSQDESRTRGRGIPLMRALSDRTAIETSDDGTTVKMVWTGVPRR